MRIAAALSPLCLHPFPALAQNGQITPSARIQANVRERPRDHFRGPDRRPLRLDAGPP